MEGLVIDCFAGGGGASTGIEAALRRPCDIAVNHDPKAIAMHKANHPDTYHVTEDIFEADLSGLVRGRHVDLMWASPDCTHHSRAKGGRPRSNGLRMLPWAIHHHASKIFPDTIIMENVPEIQKWGPLDGSGHPIKEREGETYAEFMDAMADLGYVHDSRELLACDYGAATTRQRWYAVLRRDGAPITWPERTNGTKGLPEHVPASEFLDFGNMGPSVFDRSKPLAEATQRRIMRGVRKFVFEDPTRFLMDGCRGITAPFITKYYKTGTGQRVDTPLHTITCSAGHFGLVTVELSPHRGGRGVIPGNAITTKADFGTVTVDAGGELYEISDIRLRMLTPRELMLCQGFPPTYNIEYYSDGSRITKTEAVAKIGNSVSPKVAEAIVAANVADGRKAGDTAANM